MGRPTKQGIDYFPLDCHFDDKVELYLLEKESVGLSVLITLWQLIYCNEGYYIRDEKELYLLIKKRINVDIKAIEDCINLCLCRNLFDKCLHKKHRILTSSAIQKRFFDAAKRKKSVQYNVNYLINGVNVSENAVNVVHQCLKEKEEVKEKEKEDIDKESFGVFWNEYPKKKSKGQAEKAWEKLKPDYRLLKIILDKLKEAKESVEWKKDGGQFIPHPATWLNAKGWNDEYEKDVPLDLEISFLKKETENE